MTTTLKSTILSTAVGLLLPLCSGTASAGTEKPIITRAFSNAPAMVTLEFHHSGEAPLGDNFYGFVLEQRSPDGYAVIPWNYRVWTVHSLTPNTTYRYHICAVYDYNRVCSDEDGVGDVPVTTMPSAPPPPPPRSAPPPPPPPPPPADTLPLPKPHIRANLVRENTLLRVRITWTNPVERAMYDHVKWLRNGAVAGRDVFVTRYDDVWYDPHATNRYRLCVENVASKVCSNQVTVAPVQATAPGNLKQTPSPGRVALPSSLATCSIGFVWRVARPSDLVCVTPGSRSRVAEENRTAATRVQPGGGAYGPNTCRIGYVWRGAFDGDAVCVTPQVRTLVAEENQLAASRRAAAVQQTSPGSLKLGSLPSRAAFR